MSVRITIENRHVLFFVLFLVFSIGTVYVVAQVSPNVHGHNQSCVINSWDSGVQADTLACPGGYTLVSGGCSVYGPGDGTEDLISSYPSGNGWRCGSSSSTGRYVRIYTYCCQFLN